MATLGIDVCSGACSVALLDGGEVRAKLHEPMTRGHVERLAPMVAEALDAAGKPSLETIAVTTGPGSFTGARLGVAFARGLALSTGAVSVGVTVFEAMAAGTEGILLLALPSKQDMLFVQAFHDGQLLSDPVVIPVEAAADHAPDSPFAVAGEAAARFLDHAGDAVAARANLVTLAPVTAEAIARIATAKLATSSGKRPAPLYLRPPDAKPQIA